MRCTWEASIRLECEPTRRQTIGGWATQKHTEPRTRNWARPTAEEGGGCTPLDMMLSRMRELYAAGQWNAACLQRRGSGGERDGGGPPNRLRTPFAFKKRHGHDGSASGETDPSSGPCRTVCRPRFGAANTHPAFAAEAGQSATASARAGSGRTATSTRLRRHREFTSGRRHPGERTAQNQIDPD